MVKAELSREQKELADFFPEAELPLMLSQDQIGDFSEWNKPFPQKFIEEVLNIWETEVDEFTEFLPCVSLPVQEKFVPLIYWKGGLLKYDFILVTIDKQGGLINKKPIATTIVDGAVVKQSAAYIDEDLNITIVAGQNDEGELYDPSKSKKFSMEILPNGEIVLLLDL
ncbi:MAG: hypothetical protein WAT79_16405 [Saprospiraceae bacterium]